MVDVPRRLQQSGAEKVAIIADRAAPGSHRGASQWTKPSTVKTPTPQSGSTSTGDMARLAVLYRLDTTGLASSDKVYVPSWTVIEEDFGGAALTADSAGIGVFAEGTYAVHLFVHGEGMQSAAADCAVIGFCDYTDPFFESFGVVTRGGDPSSGLLFPSTSRTYYHPGTGSGALQPGLAWVNLDTVNVSRLEFEVQVQQVV